eukprot:4084514-Pleurochrysis_carterae.AAC.2
MIQLSVVWKRRGRGSSARLGGRLWAVGASGRRRSCKSGDEKRRERSASALRVHLRCESKTANSACERQPRRAATLSSTVARDDVKMINNRHEAKKVNVLIRSRYQWYVAMKLIAVGFITPNEGRKVQMGYGSHCIS